MSVGHIDCPTFLFYNFYMSHHRYSRARTRSKIFIVVLFTVLFAITAFAFARPSDEAYAADAYFSGEGTKDSPFLIETPDDLHKLSFLVNGGEITLDGRMYSSLFYRLNSDLDMTGSSFTPIGSSVGTNKPTYYIHTLTVSYASGSPVFTKKKPTADLSESGLSGLGWNRYRSLFYVKDGDGNYQQCDLDLTKDKYPEGTEFYYKYSFETAFYGSFDGNGKTISNLTINANHPEPDPSLYNDAEVGLFGYAVNAEIKNLTLSKTDVFSSADNAFVGAFVGKASSSMVNNCALIDARVRAGGAGAVVGGGAGTFSATIAYSAHEELAGTNILPYLEDFFNKQRTPAISFFAVNNVDVIGETSGGAIGLLEEGTLSDCITNVSSDKSLIGSHGSAASVNNTVSTKCTDDKFVLFNEDFPSYSNCLYLSDVATKENSFPSCEKTTSDILTKSADELGLSGWTTFAPNGNEYYYPSPVKSVKIPITAYSVALDGKNIGLYPVKCDGSNPSFVLPKSEVIDGYDFAYYAVNGTLRAENEVITASEAIEITTYRTLLPVDKNYVADLTDVFGTTYSAETQTAANASYVDPYGRKISYEWYYSAEKDGDFLKIENSSSVLSVLNAADGGYYYCVISVTKPDGSTISLVNGQEKVTYRTKTIACTVSKLVVDVSVSTSAFSFVYDGNSRSISVSASANGLPLSLSEGFNGSLVYSVYLDGKAVTYAKDVGEYVCCAEITDETLNSNCEFVVTPCSFSVTPADITCSVTDNEGVYDENSHSVGVKSETVDGTEPTIEYSIDGETFVKSLTFTDVTDTVVYVRFSAKNHNSVVKTGKVVITPAEVTLTAKDVILSKIYDGTTAFPVESISKEHYAASCSGCSGIEVTVVRATSDRAYKGEVRVAVSFAAGKNFVLTADTIYFDGIIEAATIKIVPVNEITAVYNGKTDFRSAVKSSDYVVEVNSSANPFIDIYSAVSNSKNVSDASILTVTFSIPNENYVFENANGIYEFDFTLTKKPVTVKNPSAIAAKNREYDGTKVVTVIALEGAFKGFLTGDESTVTFYDCFIPDEKASEVAYPVTVGYALSNNPNYEVDVSSLIGLSVFIGKATPVVNPTTEVDYVYSSASHLPKISLSDGDVSGEIEWVALRLNADGTLDEGYYLTDENGYAEFGYTFTPDDKDNYLSQSGTVSLKILAVEPEDLDVVYSGSTKFFAFEKINVGFLTVKLVHNDGSTEDLSAGANGYEISYPTASSCFSAGDEYFTVSFSYGSVNLTKRVAVTVEKIVLSSSASKGEFVYGGKPFTFYPSNYDEKLMDISGNFATNVGEYEATLTIKNEYELNYVFDNGTSSCKVAFSVAPLKKYSPYLGINSYSYTGEIIRADVKNDYNSTSDFFTLSGDLTAKNAGTYTITVSLISDNYYWAETGNSSDITLTWDIRRVSVEKPTITGSPFVYDGNTHEITVSHGVGCVLTGDLTYLSSGSYVVYASLDNEDAINYVWADGTTDTVTLNYEVSKVAVNVPVPKTSFVYSGYYFVVAVSSGDYYDVVGSTREINAGHYSFNLVLKNKLDYVWNNEKRNSDDITINWQITKLGVALPSIAGQNGYTGKEQTAFISYDEKYCNVIGNIGTNAGEYEATITLKNSSNTAFSDGSENAKKIVWTIAKAAIDKPSAPENVLYNGFEQTADIALSDAYVVNNAVAKAAGTHKIGVSLADKNNYCWSDGTADDLTFDWKICSLTLSNGTSDELVTDYVLGNELVTPMRDGYKFDGWYLTEDYVGAKVTSINKLDGNVSLYAKWVKTSSDQSGSSGKKDTSSVLGTKAIVGIALACGALVIGLIIVVIAASKGRKRPPTGGSKGLF